jgi:hypothetical protein
MESTKFVASWIRDEKLDTIIPNEPKITSGRVVAKSNRVLVAAYRDRDVPTRGPGLPGPLCVSPQRLEIAVGFPSTHNLDFAAFAYMRCVRRCP